MASDRTPDVVAGKLQVGLLGPLEVWVDDRSVRQVDWRQQRVIAGQAPACNCPGQEAVGIGGTSSTQFEEETKNGDHLPGSRRDRAAGTRVQAPSADLPVPGENTPKSRIHLRPCVACKRKKHWGRKITTCTSYAATRPPCVATATTQTW
jgi:hypothetical protein